MLPRTWIVLIAAVACVSACDDGKKSGPAIPDEPALAPLPSGDDPGWLTQRTPYQLSVRSFLDTDGDGVGDLAGVTQKLDYIAGLRVGTIVLDAIQPTSLRDGNRAVSDFTGVAPDLGSLDDVDALLTAAHAADLKVVLTLPLNQTDSFHPWFRAALENTTAEAGDWYLFADAATTCDDVPLAEPPIYGIDRWAPAGIANTETVYYHRFADTSPDLNLRNADVVAELDDVIRAWLARGFDGIYLPDAYAFVENPDGDCENTGTSRDLLRHFRSVVDEFAGAALLTTDRYPGGSFAEDAARVASYVDDTAAQAVIDADLTLFVHTVGEDNFPAASFAAYLNDLQRNLASGGGATMLYTSHPERPRVSTKVDSSSPQLYRMVMNVIFSLPPTPIVFYGDEFGLGAAGNSGGDVRNLSLAPMPWTVTGPAYGFSSGTPWLSAPLGADLRNVQFALGDEGSFYWHVRRLIDLRNGHGGLRSGDFVNTAVADQISNSPLPDVVSWVRGSGLEAVIAVHNLAIESRNVVIDLSPTGWDAGQAFGDLLDPTTTFLQYAGSAAPLLRVTLGARDSLYLTALTDATGD